MNDAFILGAGFSHAVDALSMPTTEGLGTQAIEMLCSLHQTPPRVHSAICDGLSCDHPSLVEGKPPGGNFEIWLSRLVDRQPYRFEHENAFAESVYQQLASAIGDQVLWATQLACEQPLGGEPSWFERLIRAWQKHQAQVVTLNYDTLVESRYEAVVGVSQQGRFYEYGYRNLDLCDVIPPGGIILGGDGPRPERFTYIKLHGSIHWYWDPATRSADSMVDVGLPARWGQEGNSTTWQPENLVPGRRPVIVPPTTSKTVFFNNPVVRHLWRKAFEGIRQSDRVILIGYSLPVYDLLVGSLLNDAAGERQGIKATVVDLQPKPVVERLEALGYEVTHTFTTVDKFVDDYAVNV